MGIRNIQGNAVNADQVQRVLQAGTTFGNGAILIDEFDNLIFDDVFRKYPGWARIDKRLAPGETTGGFDQTAVATGRAAPVRNLGYSSTGPTRSARTRRDIKALVANSTFGMFDRSVYQQQGRRFGDLQAKDVQDLMTAVMRKWQSLFYLGNSSTPEEFDGLRLLIGAGSTINASTSVLNGIATAIVAMMNTSTKDVIPTAIYTNAQVIFYIEQELFKVGNKLAHTSFNIGQNVFSLPTLPTPAGMLPIIADPFNSSVAGTPVTYPTYIVSEDKLSWQYVEPMGNAGPEPKTFEISMTNALDLQYATVMFGALELLGGTNHHTRVNIEARTTIVDPTT